MTALRRAASAALAFAERLREAVPEVDDPDDKAHLVKLTGAVAQAQGWLEVLEERVRQKSAC